MMASLHARVGVVLLDARYLTKEWPVRELRRMMELLSSGHVRVLPVLYGMTFEQLVDQMKRLADADTSAACGASGADSDMLAKLTRTTMIRSKHR